jgi:hypothetical protein
MSKYKCWVECEKDIEAKSLEEALEIFSSESLELEFRGLKI